MYIEDAHTDNFNDFERGVELHIISTDKRDSVDVNRGG